MKRCVLNDCTGFKTVAPCCRDCPERERCPDRCPKSDAEFCVSLIKDGEDNDS